MAMTVSLLHRYTHSPPLLAGLAGNTQILPNHDLFVGWGGAPDFSEYTPSRRQIFNASFAEGVGTYRAFRFPWIGHPVTNPALAIVVNANDAVTLYASWNGATQVSAWRVLAGSGPGALRRVAQASRTGFQTVITLQHRPRYVAVQALGAQDGVLGTSKTGESPER
jgi:hypothetical protein